MNNFEFVLKLKNVLNYNTSYMLGQFGQITTTTNISRAVARTDVNNKRFEKGALSIKDKGFMFDCVCLIKGILWGWNGDKNKNYGGAKYASNGVPDIGADTMIKKCLSVSSDFSNIEIGEAVWLPGHIGVYVGNGEVIECTPKWTVSPGVKLSKLENLGFKGSMSRTWKKHGKLPWVQYIKEPSQNTESFKDIDEIPKWAEKDIEWYIQNNFLVGGTNGELNLSLDMVRLLVILKRVIER